MLLGFVELFYHPIECGAHAVCRIASPLRKTDGWFVSLDMGRVDCLACCIFVIVLGQVSAFVLCYCYCSVVMQEQVVTLAQLSQRLPYVLLLCYLALSAVLLGVEHNGFVICFVRNGAGHHNRHRLCRGGVVKN